MEYTKIKQMLELKDFYCTLWLNQNSVLSILVKKMSLKPRQVDCLGQDLSVPMTPSMERIDACDWNVSLIKIIETVEQKKHCLEIQVKRLRRTKINF